ncbi:MAG: glucan 1,3-beta-glucosidase [Proteobacteria bacterium ST_bin11]|nr:MAG: glucan 1,3-beta-glucosidase [Proteobacteria bacterium ST_bin11]
MSAEFASQSAKQLRGVNLGGWLVLEKWMTPSLFDGLNARDETSWCVELGSEAQTRLKRHWRNFITRADFAWLAEIGINAVRIPVGYWLFGADYPHHHSFGASRYPFIVGGVDILDSAFDWAEEFGLRIVVDLHAAPGCQNGFDNGGIQDVCEWHTQEAYIDYSLETLERLARRYGKRGALHGIQVLNEPRWDLGTDLLRRYTTAAYGRIRCYCPPERVAVVFHDGFRSFREYAGFLQPPEHSNVIFDIHRYQCFVPEDVDRDIYQHLQKVVCDWKAEADEIICELGLPTYVGEWSLGLDAKIAALWAQGPFDHTDSEMGDLQFNIACRGYAAAQLAVFEKYLGWFFWSYKTETMPQWSFRECVERGWLPARFA